MKTEITYFNYIDGIELPSYVVDDCPKMGACDDYIDDLLTYNEYEYHTSDDAVSEMLIENEYEFTENG